MAGVGSALRQLPAGAVAGWGLHPLESAAFSRRTPEADIIRERASLPRTISYALRDDVAFYRLHVLPHEFAAVFGQPFAIVFGRRNIGVGILFTRPDCDGAQSAERDKCPPAAAMTDAVSAAPRRVIMAANASTADALRRHSAQARRGDGSFSFWCDNARSGFPLRDCLRSGFSLRDCSRSGFPLRDCSRGGFPLRDCLRSGFPLRDCSRFGSRLRDYARRGFRLRDYARCRALGRRHTRSCPLRSCSLYARLSRARGWGGFLVFVLLLLRGKLASGPRPPLRNARCGRREQNGRGKDGCTKQRQTYIVGHCWPL